jgi:hypothetical protein
VLVSEEAVAAAAVTAMAVVARTVSASRRAGPDAGAGGAMPARM